MNVILRVARNAAVLGLLLSSSVSSAVTLGQIDTFEDGTTMQWMMGPQAPFAVTNISSGGPGGVDDNFISIIADGVGAGRRMTFFNDKARWLGDYQAANITALQMDLRNLGAAPLRIRIAFRDASTGTGAVAVISSVPVDLPVNGPWTSVVFPIGLSNLTFLNGATASALQSPIDIRILHSDTASYPGDAIVATLGVDNIQAIPEPAVVVQMVLGSLLVFAWMTWRRRLMSQAVP